jgi:hypothetical protein
MPPIELLGIYLHLARASEKRKRPYVRGRLLVLAAALAAQMRLPRVAALCRRMVLADNSNHLLARWPSLDQASQDPEFQTLLQQLQKHYSPEYSERLLHNLGIQAAGERRAYFSDEEYAAALLGTSPRHLGDEFGDLDDPA